MVHAPFDKSYDMACKEIDHLKAEVERLREENHRLKKCFPV